MTNASKRAREIVKRATFRYGGSMDDEPNHDAIDPGRIRELIAAALTATASEVRAAERERLGFGQIVMMSEQRNRPGQPPRWCALARGSKVASMGDTEEEARLRALATPEQSEA